MPPPDDFPTRCRVSISLPIAALAPAYTHAAHKRCRQTMKRFERRSSQLAQRPLYIAATTKPEDRSYPSLYDIFSTRRSFGARGDRDYSPTPRKPPIPPPCEPTAEASVLLRLACQGPGERRRAGSAA